MARRRSRFHLTSRFFVVFVLFVSAVVFTVLLVLRSRKTGEIEYGSIGAELEVSAVLVRDEAVVAVERYEKVNFSVIEGETIGNDVAVAEVFKRGYQDETMVTLLNLQKDIYKKQMELLGGTVSAELADVNARIDEVEAQIRAQSQSEAGLDMLSLEKQLKSLQAERSTLLAATVPADSTLTNLYGQLAEQQKTLAKWTRTVTNTAGTGVVSFYFDGYEQVLNANKIATVNSALITSVVKGGNTTVNTSSGSETPLYRLINTGHWFIVFTTDATAAFRLTAGEQYFVTFGDYSEDVYQATARDSVISEKKVVNILEFNVDIGKLAGIRTVKATVTKSAQGLVVPVSALVIENGVAGINISYGDTPLRVEVDVLSEDGDKAVIKPRNQNDSLAVGQKYIKP